MVYLLQILRIVSTLANKLSVLLEKFSFLYFTSFILSALVDEFLQQSEKVTFLETVPRPHLKPIPQLSRQSVLQTRHFSSLSSVSSDLTLSRPEQ